MRVENWYAWRLLILMGPALLVGVLLPLPGSAAAGLPGETFIGRPLQPSPDAMFDMGQRYERGDGVRQDYEKAFGWYLKAARLGLGRAQTRVGLFYEQGLGVRQNFVKARKWYERAIRHGDRQGGEEGMGRLAARMIPPP